MQITDMDQVDIYNDITDISKYTPLKYIIKMPQY